MASKASMINRPDAFSVVETPAGKAKIESQNDHRSPSCTIFTIYVEDHTLGNLMRCQLMRDPDVVFAGYRNPHPLENVIEIRIQTNGTKSPHRALSECVTLLKAETDSLQKQFKDEMKMLA
ncbi:MAG: uncharacterized protein KVP18_001325 [Porospora cf. gigantea A]|uniref:uncharacterized protein n=1 Tax=Porospora cf. gigantea A TaxID=2853593 RepID=UPI00355A48D1|nr:MAG: hypothetical protein KVP18_001325 [Porospora cf. gigantea A]